MDFADVDNNLKELAKRRPANSTWRGDPTWDWELEQVRKRMSGEVIQERRFIDYDSWRAGMLEVETEKHLKRFGLDHSSSMASADAIFVQTSFDVLQSATVSHRFRTMSRRPAGRRT